MVFAERENQPFWKIKFSLEDFSCHEIKFLGNKIIFDLFRRDKIPRITFHITPQL